MPPMASTASATKPTDVARSDRPYDVGIAGAGQLARMTCLAAWPLGIASCVLGAPDEPASGLAAGVVDGDWRDAAAVARLGTLAGVVTLENEFVDAAALAAVEAAGTPVRPDSATIAASCRTRPCRRSSCATHGLPVPRFEVARAAGELDAARPRPGLAADAEVAQARLRRLRQRDLRRRPRRPRRRSSASTAATGCSSRSSCRSSASSR